MSYPSTIATIPNPNATDRLNSPSHSSIHTLVNDNIQAIQTFVGTLSSTAGSLTYDIRSANSDGGGHVQTANKGGTGQTVYTKGDLLVAKSSSVLSRIAVGGDGTVLVADSTQETGVKWGAIAGAHNAIAGQSFTGGNIPQTGYISAGASMLAASVVSSITTNVAQLPYNGYSKFAQKQMFTGSILVSSVIVANASAGGGASLTLDVSIVADYQNTPTGSVIAKNLASVYTSGGDTIHDFVPNVELNSKNYWIVGTANNATGGGGNIRGASVAGASTFALYYDTPQTWSVLGDSKAKISLVTREIGGRIYVTDTTKPEAYKCDGFAVGSTSVGGVVPFISRYGGFPVTSFTSLNPGSIYYANGFGTISDASVMNIKVGKALTVNNLFAASSVY